ncbi:MAG: FAD-binding oxidoreductase [Gammaproteobacteria bacterium]|nr:FAD-binding oxidoreductase [Gammaproteobacteria bacterium]MYJ52523.1 FAD-binding oxidoreductase [Gammaproteobacteria bacterium]
MNEPIFSPDYVSRPYWWDRTSRPQLDDSPLPKSADVVVLGSGYTGLSAAIQTARHGLQTVVLDAEDAGWGCSSRNGGQISISIKSSFGELCRQYGQDGAIALMQTGADALDWVGQFIRKNRIDCDFRQSGRFQGAHSPRAFKEMSRMISETPETMRNGAYPVSVEQQKEEIGTDFYHGGSINPRYASVDPARYHRGMLERAVNAGCGIITHCRATDLHRQGGIFRITTAKGQIRSRNVIVATNGYTGIATPWLRRRIIPIGSYIIATEPLPKGMIDVLLPTDRMITDTLKLVVYYRACPDRKRILFGGRVSVKETDPTASAPRLRDMMLKRFPSLGGIRITHSWMGFVGYTFDRIPHLGVQNGLHYCMGYCGSGISLSSYLGSKTGLKVAGQPGGDSPLDRLNFKGRFYYRGNPWFLKPSIFYYRCRDRISSRANRSR